VGSQRAVQKPRAGHAGSKLVQRLDAGGDDARIARQPQIVVRADHNLAMSLHRHFDVLFGFEVVKIRINAKFFVFVDDGKLVALFK